MIRITAGSVCIVDRTCGAMYTRPFAVRVIRERDWPIAAERLVWVNVYQLTSWGDASRERDILVDRAGFLAAIRIGFTPGQRRVIPSPRRTREVSNVDA